MTNRNQGMSRYNPTTEIGYGCHSCRLNSNGCTGNCTPTENGGTEYIFNEVYNHKMWWLIKHKLTVVQI